MHSQGLLCCLCAQQKDRDHFFLKKNHSTLIGNGFYLQEKKKKLSAPHSSALVLPARPLVPAAKLPSHCLTPLGQGFYAWRWVHGWLGHLFSHLCFGYVAFIQAFCFPGMHFRGRKKKKQQSSRATWRPCNVSKEV